MSPRNRTVSDEEILRATAEAVAELGPARLTLAEIARRVGLAAPTLVQRFGSKRRLLLALAQQGAGGFEAEYAAIRAGASSPLDALKKLLLCFPGSIDSAETLSNHIAFLQMDLNDPEFRVHAAAHARWFRGVVAGLVQEAIDAGELVPCDPERLARMLNALVGGSMLAWAIEREGALIDQAREDLELVLERFGAEGGA